MTVTTLAYIPSPAQGVWFIGPVPLRAYALCIIIGIVAALVIGDRRWEARGGERGVIYDIALWAVPFGLVGGRIYHVLTDWPTYFGAGGAGLGAAFRIWDGGLGIWGAVALGGVGAWLGCRQRGIPLPAFGDAIAPGIILAQAIGRLGNYFNQELYGRATTLPWGLEIYERRDAAGFRDSLNGVSTGELVGVVHPTFLYELLWNLLIFALLIWIDRRYQLGHGKVFALYVAGYCLGRFWIELMRSDTATLIAGIRVNSFTSTFIFIAAVVYVMVAPKGREDPESLRGKDNADEESVVDEVATEVIAVGAGAGVVAAAKVAGAAESEDSGKPDPVEEAKVADAADEADEVEEPVETEVLVVDEPETVEPVETEESVVADESAEAEAAAVDFGSAEDAADEPADVEPVDSDLASGAVGIDVTPDDAVDVEAESDEPEADVVVDESSAEAEAESVEPAATPVGAPAVDDAENAEPEVEVVEDESAEAEAAEGDSGEAAVSDAELSEVEIEDTGEPAAPEATYEAAVSEVLTAQAVAAEELAEVVEPAEEVGAEAEEPTAAEETSESAVSEVLTAQPPVVADEQSEAEESAEAEGAEVAQAGVAESDSGEVATSDAETDEPVAESEATSVNTDTGTDTKSPGERFRKPRWFRRNS